MTDSIETAARAEAERRWPITKEMPMDVTYFSRLGTRRGFVDGAAWQAAQQSEPARGCGSPETVMDHATPVGEAWADYYKPGMKPREARAFKAGFSAAQQSETREESEADADLAAGRYRDFDNAEDAVGWIFDDALSTALTQAREALDYREQFGMCLSAGEGAVNALRALVAAIDEGKTHA